MSATEGIGAEPLASSGPARRRRAPVSLATLAAAGTLSVVSWTTGSHPPEWMGAFWQPAVHVWGGAWWVLGTGALLHTGIIHLAFNGYWMVVLGGAAERLAGTGRAALFGVAAAFAASGLELVCTDEVGVGLSGVVYAVFGFAWRRSRTDPAWAALAPKDVVRLFVGWFVLCFVLTILDIWRVGNFAHLGGALVGLAVARATERGTHPALRAVLLGGPVVAAAAAVLVGPPWSASLAAARAESALDARDAAGAVVQLERAAARGYDRIWCLQMLSWAYLTEGRTADYERTMEEIRALDPEAHRRLVAHYGERSTGGPR